MYITVEISSGKTIQYNRAQYQDKTTPDSNSYKFETWGEKEAELKSFTHHWSQDDADPQAFAQNNLQTWYLWFKKKTLIRFFREFIC